MGINLFMTSYYANKLDDYADTLREIKNNLNNYKVNLNNNWKAEEMFYFINAIDSINNEIARLAPILESLRSDIIYTAEEIRREEEARAAAAARAEAARLAQQKK